MFFILISFIPLIHSVWSQFNTQPFGPDQFGGNQLNPFGNQPDQFPYQQPGQDQFGNRPVSNNPYENEYRNQGNDLYAQFGNPNKYRNDLYGDTVRCPQHWIQFQQSCYRFIKSPHRNRNDARRNCQAYGSDLASINNFDEHGFIIYHLMWTDPQKRKWYISTRQQGPGYWLNDGDQTQMVGMDNAFLPSQDDNFYGRDFLVYSHSTNLNRWGFEAVKGDDMFLYICEVPIGQLHYITIDDRGSSYGIDIDDPERIPKGPFFIKQPTDVVFDVSKRSVSKDVFLRCIAGGYPAPAYDWFKEEYENDKIVSKRIDPLTDSRYTLSGGTLIIYDPRTIEERGSYHCTASNEFGKIMSETVTLSFGNIAEFNLKRSPEYGTQNWGKAVYCDPPQHYPDVTYYWNRDYFPNFVEEDKRVFVSNDGALYFSALEPIDKGNYSCSVKSKDSSTGRNGPFFPLIVNSNPNYQQPKFPNNFPKAFPEAPIAGRDVRLECIAFGYPVPQYNWTRRGAPLPKGAYSTNYNRVLTIPNVAVEDLGDYVCRAFNSKASIENSVTLSIQAEPNFTIPLTDKHMDLRSDLTWNCEAFGIPDVNYTWYKNGELLDVLKLLPEDRERYYIQDNVLTIKYLDAYRDPGMYQCAASNVLKTRYSSAQLRVLSLKPSFQKRPLELETYAAEQGNVTIVCNPEAAPRPKFVWKKDGNVIGAGGRRRILENGNLIISPVSRDDEGLYTCTASNEYGVDESRGRLIVLRGPHLYRSLPSQVVTAVMLNFTLQCQAESEDILDMAYIWTHNGLLIRDRHPHQIRMFADGGTLHVINTTLAEAGEYECIVRSAVGLISTKTRVIVEGPPGPPGGVQVVDVTKTSATLQWTDGTSNGQPIFAYQISCRTNWNSTWVNLSQIVEAREVDRYNGRKEANLGDLLSPWSAYEFRVSGINPLGLGPPSAPSPQYSTPSDHPYKVPSHLGGGGGKINDLTITWTPLPSQDQNAPGIYYKIFWRRKGANEEFQSQELKEFGNVGVAVVRLPGGYYYTQYEVKVQAINEIGKGPTSPIATIFSAEDMPLVQPQQVYARSYNSTSLQVFWKPVDESRETIRGKLIGYRLKYWKQSDIEENSVYYLSRSTVPTALIVGLQPDTYYWVEVMAFNSAGEGPESERRLERTYRKAPQKPPSSVFAIGVDPSTVKVVWRYVSPSGDEEPVLGYRIRVWERDQDMSTANDTTVLIGNKLEAYITNLSPGKAYHMRILAFSNGGDGRMSSPPLTFQMGSQAAFRNTGHQNLSNIALVITVLLSLLVFFKI